MQNLRTKKKKKKKTPHTNQCLLHRLSVGGGGHEFRARCPLAFGQQALDGYEPRALIQLRPGRKHVMVGRGQDTECILALYGWGE